MQISKYFLRLYPQMLCARYTHHARYTPNLSYVYILRLIHVYIYILNKSVESTQNSISLNIKHIKAKYTSYRVVSIIVHKEDENICS